MVFSIFMDPIKLWGPKQVVCLPALKSGTACILKQLTTAIIFLSVLNKSMFLEKVLFPILLTNIHILNTFKIRVY